MRPSEDEIEARLSALRRQREALDREIADHLLYLELGRRLRSPPRPVPTDDEIGREQDAVPALKPATARPPDRRTPLAFAQDPVGARRYGRALVDAACAAISRAGRPLHAGEILEALVAEGFTVPGQDPVAALNTRLWKRSGTAGPLRRLGDAVYALPTADGDDQL